MQLTGWAADRDDAGAVVRFTGHPWHEHPEPQLVYVAVGHGLLRTPGEEFALGAQDAVWLPGRCPHAFTLSAGGVALGPLLSPATSPPDGRPRALVGHPRLPALMTTLLGVAPGTDDGIAHFRDAIADLLAATVPGWFELTIPTHPQAALIAECCVDSTETLEQLARRHFVSARQVRRVFLAQTRMSFAQWRTRARLNIAIDLLFRGAGLRTAAASSAFATREGLLKALARECRVPLPRLGEDPAAALAEARTPPPVEPTSAG